MGPLAASLSLPTELKYLFNEFRGFWQFDATRIAHMLSPTVTPPSILVDVAYSLLKQNPSDWPKDAEDTSFHEPLVDSLNDFLNASHLALDTSNPPIIDREDRWYRGLRFRLLGDGTCNLHSPTCTPIKREAVGGISFGDASRGVEFAVPVKLDEDWPAVIAQAARSAQILYSMNSWRKFVLIIVFRHPTLELRFLILHRGGLTASKPLSVVGEEGKKDILRVFLSMLMWENGEDAGLCPDQMMVVE